MTDHTERLGDPFDPKSGRFADGQTRDADSQPSDDLRESMRAVGWLPEFPAWKDERGVVLVGHQRLAVAKELGIPTEGHVLTVECGTGDEADERRLRMALFSNVGQTPYTVDERRRLAAYLYGEREWSIKRVGAALGVSASTISRDGVVSRVGNANRKDSKGRRNTGRPAGAANKLDSAKDALLQAEIARRLAAGENVDGRGLAADFGISTNTVHTRTVEVKARLKREAEEAAEVEAGRGSRIIPSKPEPKPRKRPTPAPAPVEDIDDVGPYEIPDDPADPDVEDFINEPTPDTWARHPKVLAVEDDSTPKIEDFVDEPAHAHRWVCAECGQPFRH